MEPDQLRDGDVQELLDPEYWLVFALDWPSGSNVAEGALAVAPSAISRDTASFHAQQVLGCADLHAEKHAANLVLFSDLTRMFATAGTSWASLGVDWQAALRELEEGRHPLMLLTITERAHLLISDPGQSPEQVDYERELLRQAISGRLTEDWPTYIQGWAGEIEDVDEARHAGMWAVRQAEYSEFDGAGEQALRQLRADGII